MINRIWFGDSNLDRAARTALTPVEGVFAAVSGLRTLLYDAGWLKSEVASVPTVSVGNLSVGGTGKTPIAAWVSACLHDRDARPAIVMRGYGADEPEVHRRLNPDINVVVDADRVRGVESAVRQGADVVVLDDAFQHRRLARTADIVLVSADQWSDDIRLLPAGPWREPLSALRRADLIVVTRKSVSTERVDHVHEKLSSIVPRVPRVSVHLAPAEVRLVGGLAHEDVESLRGEHVMVVVAIGDPMAFLRQLEMIGARADPHVFPDHHEFSGDDIQRLLTGSHHGDRVLCTLKDAVKLEKIWPRDGPRLWYVSQRVIVERGVGGMETLLTAVLAARHSQ
jgi:tetraacyldisaccharide 4'-kinase